MELIKVQFMKLGVPTDNRFTEEVRDRARKLAAKRPNYYQFEGYVLWVSTLSDEAFNIVYRWVLENEGTEPE